jgi:hypothetical protein
MHCAQLAYPAAMPRPFSTDIAMLGSTSAGSSCFLLHTERESNIPESVYKVIELIGTSKHPEKSRHQRS